MCHCGKRTYLFSQCKDCARQEAHERHEEAAAAAEQETESDQGVDPGIDPVPVVHDVAFASDAWVTCAVRSVQANWARIPEPGPPAYAAALDWLHGQDLVLPLPPPESPTTTVWSIFPDGSVMHLQDLPDA